MCGDHFDARLRLVKLVRLDAGRIACAGRCPQICFNFSYIIYHARLCHDFESKVLSIIKLSPWKAALEQWQEIIGMDCPRYSAGVRDRVLVQEALGNGFRAGKKAAGVSGSFFFLLPVFILRLVFFVACSVVRFVL